MLQAAGLLFFAFAGYARVATLGEEVRDPARVIPRAMPAALGLVVVVYAVVGASVLLVLGADRLAASTAPLEDAVAAGWLAGLGPLVRVGAVAAAAGVLLSLLAGVGRTTLAMARDRELPGWLAAVHPRHHVPHRAELAVGAPGRGDRRGRGRAHRDRLLRPRSAGLLRDRERQRVDAGRAAPVAPGRWPRSGWSAAWCSRRRCRWPACWPAPASSPPGWPPVRCCAGSARARAGVIPAP